MREGPASDPASAGLTVYTVGGAVRDRLLGRPVTDRDHVVVGATPEDMLARGFEQVGRDFPVFLHPVTHEEYALARTERKRGRGHTGFDCHASPGVTLEEDLARRDLTVNAMAEGPDGSVIDPYGGRRDLERGYLRHVSDAYVEDPLRVLRTARFAATLDFDVAPETLRLMRVVARSGELSTLTAERVWQETRKALQTARPFRYFDLLATTEALPHVFPELAHCRETDGAAWEAMRRALDAAAATDAPLSVRTAVVFAGLGALRCREALIRLKAPRQIQDLARLSAQHHDALVMVEAATAAALNQLIKSIDALRRPGRIPDLMTAACLLHDTEPGPRIRFLEGCIDVLAEIDYAALAASTGDPATLARRIDEARVSALADYLSTDRDRSPG